MENPLDSYDPDMGPSIIAINCTSTTCFEAARFERFMKQYSQDHPPIATFLEGTSTKTILTLGVSDVEPGCLPIE